MGKGAVHFGNTNKTLKSQSIDQFHFSQVKYVNNANNALQAALSLAKLTSREEPIFVGIHCRFSFIQDIYDPHLKENRQTWSEQILQQH